METSMNYHDLPTKQNLEDNLWICRECKGKAHLYFRVTEERMKELENEWKERLESGNYAI